MTDSLPQAERWKRMSKSKSRPQRIKMAVGVKVKSLHPSGEEGVVVAVSPHNPRNPISEHGMIEFKVTGPCNSTYLKVGDDEHYVEYEWEKHLKVIG